MAAYPLQSTAKLLWDDHLHSRRFFSWVHRPITGPGPLPGPALRMAEGGSRVRGYAPLLGEHNREVLLGPAGLTEEDYRRLDEAEVLS